jgi:hypothetical protein
VMDTNDQFTLKYASVARRVRNFPLTDAHVWGDAWPEYQYAEPAHHPRSLAYQRGAA